MISEELKELFQQIWSFEILKIQNISFTVKTLFLSILALFLSVKFSKILSKFLSRRLFSKFAADKTLLPPVEILVFYFLCTLFILTFLNWAKIPLSAFAFIGGALAIGVGFGSQNIVNNFISGIILIFERPIKVGDYIEVDDLFGEVQYIGFRSTQILSIGNRHIIVPNSTLLENKVLNWTHKNKIVRTRVSVGVAYGTDPKKVKNLLLQSLENHSRVLQFPEPLVLFTDFSDSSLNFELTFSSEILSLRDKEIIASDIRFKIDEIFRENKIAIPFPQRDVNLTTKEPLTVQLQS